MGSGFLKQFLLRLICLKKCSETSQRRARDSAIPTVFKPKNEVFGRKSRILTSFSMESGIFSGKKILSRTFQVKSRQRCPRKF